MTPRDKIKDKFALMFCNALMVKQKLQPITLLDLTVNKDVANDFYVLAEAILNALPVEWVDSESEAQNKDICEFHNYDLDGDIEYKEFGVLSAIDRVTKIIQRNSKPVINVDEIKDAD
jgi:hypothetical protein